MKAKRIVTNAMLIALYVVLSLYSVNTGTMKISFDSFPIVIGAALLGPIDGMIIGLFGSFINQMITYGASVTTLLWIIPAGVRGLIVGLYSKKHRYEMTKKESYFICIISSLIVTALNTVVIYLDSVIYGYYSVTVVFGALIPRITAGVITAFVLALILPYVIQRLKNIRG